MLCSNRFGDPTWLLVVNPLDPASHIGSNAVAWFIVRFMPHSFPCIATMGSMREAMRAGYKVEMRLTKSTTSMPVMTWSKPMVG